MVARRLGLRLGALLFCTDNVTLAESGDQVYRGLSEPRVRAGFEAAAGIALAALAEAGGAAA